MDTVATQARNELEALREQLAPQQQLLADKDAQLERKQLMLDESNEHIAWL